MYEYVKFESYLYVLKQHNASFSHMYTCFTLLN